MSFAGISGINININHKSASPIEILFAEEVGWLLEIDEKNHYDVLNKFENLGVPAFVIGQSEGF